MTQLKYTIDADLIRKRSSILSLGIDDLSEYHTEAAKYAERDIEQQWYRAAASEFVQATGHQTEYERRYSPSFLQRYSVDFRETPFDASLLYSGWHYLSSETSAVQIGERVRIVADHTAGGEPGTVYIRADAVLPESDLSLVDYTGDGWELNTAENQLLDLVSYKTLFLIYQHMAGDHVKGDKDFASEQRDYFDECYKAELKRLTDYGLDYDWDVSGLIDDDEKAISVIGERRTSAVW